MPLQLADDGYAVVSNKKVDLPTLPLSILKLLRLTSEEVRYPDADEAYVA
jgi:hypothetical protein